MLANLVCFKSKKQPMVSRNSVESKLKDVTLGACEAIWIKKIISRVKF